MKIRNKLIICFLAIGLFGIIAIMADFFYNVDKLIVSNTEKQLQDIAEIQKSRTEEIYSKKIELLKQISGRTGIIDNLASYNARPNDADKASLQTRVTDAKNSVSDFNNVAIIGLDNQIIVTADQSINLSQYYDLTSFSDDANEQEARISINKTNNKKLIIHGPIQKEGQTIGILLIVSEIKDLQAVTDDLTGLGQTGEITLAGRNENGDAVFLKKPRFSSSVDETIVSKNDFNVAITQALLKNEKLFKNLIDYRGHSVYAVTKYIPELDWGLVVKVDKAEIYQPIYSHATQIGVITLTLLIITLLASIRIANSISKPIETLKKGADEISKGNYSHKVDINSKDEIGRLSSAFNTMVSAVVASRAEVDKKVEEQTGEIVEKQKDMEDQQKAILNILEDVEEEKTNVSHEKDKIDAILHSIGDGVFVTDQDLNIVIFNSISAELSGYSVEEAIGKKYSDILKFSFEDTGKINDEFIQNVMKTGAIQEMANHTQITKKDGTKIPVADSAAPLLNKDGKVTGCVVVFRDVSKEREVDKAKTEFVSLASHQLRTPLSSVNWYAEMLLAGDAGKLTPKQKEFVDQIYQGNQRMVDLVNALLNVSRIELGTFAIDPEPVDIIEMSKSVILEQKETIEKKKLAVKEKYDQIPKFNADPKLLRIVVQNYVSNSIKYTPDKGTVEVAISLLKKGEKAIKSVESDSILISVTDSGYGIPKAQQKDIFGKLFRADNVREKDTEGTGLGLYIVKSIAENSRGEAWFKSEENKGSTFYFLMPLDGMKKKEGTKTLE